MANVLAWTAALWVHVRGASVGDEREAKIRSPAEQNKLMQKITLPQNGSKVGGKETGKDWGDGVERKWEKN